MSTDRRRLSSALLAQIGAWGALVSALGASVYLAFAPVYASASRSTAFAAGSLSWPPAPLRRAHAATTLAAVNGPIVFAWFGVTLLVAALPLLFRRTRFARGAATMSALFLLVFVVLGSASIGGAYVPAVAFALLAAAVTPSSRSATQHSLQRPK